MDQKIAVVTGTNRGIGKEITHQLVENGFLVIATGRDLVKVKNALGDIGDRVVPHALDVNSTSSIQEFSDFCKSNYSKIDVLVNNAGIMLNDPMVRFNLDQIAQVMDTNFYGPIRLTKYLMPLLEKSEGARIINISSEMGSTESFENGGFAAYRLSKWSLNGFTQLLAAELKNTNIKVNSMCPGWVQTDMGGQTAPRKVEQGAATATWLATSNDIGTGKFYTDKKEIPW